MVNNLHTEIAMLKGDLYIVYNSTPTTANLIYKITILNRKLNILNKITKLKDLKALFKKQMLRALNKNNNLQQQVQDGQNAFKDTKLQLKKEKEENAGLRGIINSSILNKKVNKKK